MQQYPLVHGWLTAKFFALIAYIVLGTIALKRGKTRASASLPGSPPCWCSATWWRWRVAHDPFPFLQ